MFGLTNVTFFCSCKLFKNIYRYSSVLFHLIGLTEKVSRVKEKTRFLMSSYTYLALGISNPVGAKLSRWRLGINSFGASGDLHRSYTKCDHCHAGAKLFRSYFGIISSRRQISSTYGFYQSLTIATIRTRHFCVGYTYLSLRIG